MHIQKRKNLFITFLIITVLTVLVWGVSKYIQPILPAQVNADLILVLASLVGVITILTGIPDIFERITKFISGEDKKGIFTEKQNRHNREVMLIRVWDAWIEGVLKKSLYNEVRMQLGLELHPEAVENPWDSILQRPEQESVSIPVNKKILDIFNECGKSLVIVGEPGSGKTTELLELASQAIESAKNNLEQPIPVVFNLSSWMPKLTLKEWLVNELWERYRISPKLGSYWIEKNELMLLLDGLDEVKNEFRNQCVQAINEFIKQQTAPIVICCRRSEFEDLETRINVHGAIFIQPLISRQVMKYLKKAGSKLTGIYHKIKANSDAESLNFIHTPLFLSILILAYRDASDQEIESFVESGNYRKHLFDFYLEQMFKRRGKPLYTLEQTKSGLAWLASRMVENGFSVFYIESIQLNWLNSDKQRKFVKLFSVASCSVFFGLIYGLIGGLKGVLGFWLSFGLIVGLIVGLILVLHLDRVKPVYKLDWSRSRMKRSLVFGLIYGLIFGPIFWLASELMGGLSGGPIGELSGGLIGGLDGGLVGVLIVGLSGSLPGGLILWLIFGLIFGLIFWLTYGLISGLDISEIEIHDKPDQSLRNSLKNFLVVWLSSWVIFVLGFGPIVGLLGGLMVGLIYGLIYGGQFLITHILLRWQLYRAIKIPIKLISFLDFAAERVFLRKVSGGYIFIHRMVMEHFAEMAKEY